MADEIFSDLRPRLVSLAYRLNPQSEWIRAEAPELRIVS